MKVQAYVCRNCNKNYKPHPVKYHCSCGGNLDIKYAGKILHKTWQSIRKNPAGQWRYHYFYPDIPKVNQITFHEGNTPLLPAQKGKIFLKCEHISNTGSFKDRGSTIEVSKAAQQNAKHIVLASTGNMASSVASYAAQAGITATAVLPSYLSKQKEAMIKRFGAHIQKVKGDYTEAAKKAIALAHKNRWYLCGDYAYRSEGEKGVALEIFDQLDSLNKETKTITLPIGNGTLISSTWRACIELQQAGLLNKLPKLIGVQAKECAPVEQAWKKYKRSRIIDIEPVYPHTKATAIACGDPSDGDRAIEAIIESKGFIISVSDKEMLKAKQILAQTEGIDTELSGAASFAAWQHHQLPTVCVITGHGLKENLH